jgi:hypothetical protein
MTQVSEELIKEINEAGETKHQPPPGLCIVLPDRYRPGRCLAKPEAEIATMCDVCFHRSTHMFCRHHAEVLRQEGIDHKGCEGMCRPDPLVESPRRRWWQRS